ncbi:MAG: UDP-N-acetylglucosamine 2-epimerase [Nitrososphaeraceae archaeon]|nr:UDP-N-acetylglucosamine 2-epimerase [Nitrososphaeraceae archaeon]
MAPVIKELDKKDLPFKLVLTGQHSETMDEIIESFGIRKPDDILVKYGESNTSYKLFRWLVTAFISIPGKDYFGSSTRLILVHGDTLSALFGGIVGKLKNIPVAHVEAGLRSFNYFNPFPEELIRVLVSKIATVHFCPGEWACNNLKKSNGEIINTKINTLYDSFVYAMNKKNEIENENQVFAIVSMHRHENLSNKKRLDFLIQQIIEVSHKIPLKFILHPVTRQRLIKSGWLRKLQEQSEIELYDRMNYIDFIHLLSDARFILTDGGSNQEETSYMNKPCLLLRSHTERNEGLSENVKISNYDPDIIKKFISDNLQPHVQEHPGDINKSGTSASPSNIIVDYLSNY